MLLNGIRLILVLAMLTLVTSCNRANAPQISPASTAYSDGFEVVVFEVLDGAPTNVRSVPLKEAEHAIAMGAQASIAGDPVAIQQQLSTGKSGDSRVVMIVNSLDAGKQRVRLAFHESSRTFFYEYAVDGAKITPLSSGYRDLGKSTAVRYTSE